MNLQHLTDYIWLVITRDYKSYIYINGSTVILTVLLNVVSILTVLLNVLSNQASPTAHAGLVWQKNQEPLTQGSLLVLIIHIVNLNYDLKLFSQTSYCIGSSITA